MTECERSKRTVRDIFGSRARKGDVNGVSAVRRGILWMEWIFGMRAVK
jgi:hypothetical protein